MGNESFVLQVSLAGMAPEDFLAVELPSEFLAGTVSGLLDLVFPPDEESRLLVSDRFDLRANPDLPEIYAVLLAVCEEWRDWRCALTVSAHRERIELSMPVSQLIRHTDGPPFLRLRLEQEYRAVEYAVRHGIWDSRDELLGWMRSLVTLYFLDKHEAILAAPPPLSYGPALANALRDLEAQGLIAAPPPENLPLPPEESCGEGVVGESAPYAITPEGRRFIARLLAETESYIDQYDHYQDTLAGPLSLPPQWGGIQGGAAVEFGTGRGVDLRVEAFLAEGLDPLRTVFLLRLYDGTLDSRLRDWMEAIENEELFEGLLEPVVNRHSLGPDEILEVMEQGHAWLEEQREQDRREREDRDLLRRAGGGAPQDPKNL